MSTQNNLIKSQVDDTFANYIISSVFQLSFPQFFTSISFILQNYKTSLSIQREFVYFHPEKTSNEAFLAFYFLFLAEFIRAQNTGRLNLFVDERAWNKFGACLASDFFLLSFISSKKLKLKTVLLQIRQRIFFFRLINRCTNFLNSTITKFMRKLCEGVCRR